MRGEKISNTASYYAWNKIREKATKLLAGLDLVVMNYSDLRFQKRKSHVSRQNSSLTAKNHLF